MLRLKIKESNVSELIKLRNFKRAVKYTHVYYRPRDAAWYLYRELIELHKQFHLPKLLKAKKGKRDFMNLYMQL